MRGRRRSATLVAGALLLVPVTGCADIRGEIAANGTAEPAPTPTLTPTPAPTPVVTSAPGDVPTPRPAPTRTPGPDVTRGPCLASGVSFGHDPVDAAMGRRAVVITMTNCGERPYTVDGYPEIGVQDTDHNSLHPTLTHGDAYTDAARDQGPRKITLAPGNTVLSVLNWRAWNRPEGPGVGSYLVIAPARGQERGTLPLWIDIMEKDNLDVTAWATSMAHSPS
ncbi:DUF4232 domain-containing protein [Streptomyces sp. 150FB]|uniref:DUF4232 domain-containing protein n=1 Tax=Streptomyces sp. 150FB TaxID=1576605 RepID=UPI00099D7AA0|nr:DUF4232 domain-containing protein [Streptomyces sp. 150FB]